MMKHWYVYFLIFAINCNHLSEKSLNNIDSEDSNEYGLNDLVVPDENDSVLNLFKAKHQQILDSMISDYLINRDSFFNKKIHFDNLKNNLEWNGVKLIVQKNCTPCHQTNGVAPFSFNKFEDIKEKSITIQHVLNNKIMPPWTANEGHELFYNAPELSDTIRFQLINWLENLNTHQTVFNQYANDKIEPLIRVNSRKPDLVLKTTNASTIKTNDDTYQCLMFDLNNDEQFDVSSIEYKFNIPGLVHHIMLFVDTIKRNYKSEDLCDCSFYNLNKTTPIDGYTMGMRPLEFTSNFNYKIPKKSRLILQIHIGSGGNKGKRLITTVNLYKKKDVRKSIPMDFLILNNFKIFIPKNQVITQSIIHKVKDSIAIIGLSPHMHYIARTCKAYAITPDGKYINIISFSNWNYLWGGRFIYYKPVIVPKNSIIYLDVVFDNTVKNIFQPNNPVRDVIFELNSNDEMLSLYGYYVKYQKGIENMNICKFLY